MSQHAKVVLKQASVYEPNHKRASSSTPSIGVIVVKVFFSQSSPCITPFIIMVAVCRQNRQDGKEPCIQVNSQSERFLDYSLFIPVIPPAVVWSLWKMCVWVNGARANELRAGLLIVSRLQPTQKAHSNHQASPAFRVLQASDANQ